MKWYFIDTGLNTGKYNMQLDIDLASHCKNDEAFLRFYQWEPYCISLGANQSYDDIDVDSASHDKLDIVKRPTGGRAILHAEELTYSLVIPTSFGLGAREVYEKMSRSLVNGLRMYHPKLNDVYLEPIQPHFRDELSKPAGALCFASTAQNEIKFANKKLVGSAQRKLNTSILQHGSILIGKFHRRLVKYVKSTGIDQSLNNSTIEIENITGKKVDLTDLKNSLIGGFENEWNIKFEIIDHEFLHEFSSQVSSKV